MNDFFVRKQQKSKRNCSPNSLSQFDSLKGQRVENDESRKSILIIWNIFQKEFIEFKTFIFLGKFIVYCLVICIFCICSLFTFSCEPSRTHDENMNIWRRQHRSHFIIFWKLSSRHQIIYIFYDILRDLMSRWCVFNLCIFLFCLSKSKEEL